MTTDLRIKALSTGILTLGMCLRMHQQHKGTLQLTADLESALADCDINRFDKLLNVCFDLPLTSRHGTYMSGLLQSHALDIQAVLKDFRPDASHSCWPELAQAFEPIEKQVVRMMANVDSQFSFSREEAVGRADQDAFSGAVSVIRASELAAAMRLSPPRPPLQGPLNEDILWHDHCVVESGSFGVVEDSLDPIDMAKTHDENEGSDKISFVIIDPQVDFSDTNGGLYVSSRHKSAEAIESQRKLTDMLVKKGALEYDDVLAILGPYPSQIAPAMVKDEVAQEVVPLPAKPQSYAGYRPGEQPMRHDPSLLIESSQSRTVLTSNVLEAISPQEWLRRNS